MFFCLLLPFQAGFFKVGVQVLFLSLKNRDLFWDIVKQGALKDGEHGRMALLKQLHHSCAVSCTLLGCILLHRLQPVKNSFNKKSFNKMQKLWSVTVSAVRFNHSAEVKECLNTKNYRQDFSKLPKLLSWLKHVRIIHCKGRI